MGNGGTSRLRAAGAMIAAGVLVAGCGTSVTAPPARVVVSGERAPVAQRVSGAALVSSVSRVAPVAFGRTRVSCRKCVALTFDDGPGAATPALLRHLARYRAKATFFVVGRNAAASPGLVRAAHRAGHEIGSHTWSHPDLTRLTAAGVRAELARADRAIRAATGAAPRLIRPPYGALNATVRAQTSRPMVLWSVDTLDWRTRDSRAVARKAVKAASPGSVILFHDIHPTTVAAIPAVLEALSRRGYRFVTVSRLYGGRPPKIVYGH